jgi:hypothetical protein
MYVALNGKCSIIHLAPLNRKGGTSNVEYVIKKIRQTY